MEYVYIRVEGATQSEFDPGLPVGNTTESVGGVDVSNHLECWDFRAEVVAGYEETTGLATGARTHIPTEFKFRMCKAYPLFVNAIKNNENLTFEVKMFRTMDTGGREQYVAINYTNGRCVGLDTSTGDANSPVGAGVPIVRVRFTFQDVAYESMGEWGGTSGEDNWKTTE